MPSKLAESEMEYVSTLVTSSSVTFIIEGFNWVPFGSFSVMVKLGKLFRRGQLSFSSRMLTVTLIMALVPSTEHVTVITTDEYISLSTVSSSITSTRNSAPIAVTLGDEIFTENAFCSSDGSTVRKHWPSGVSPRSPSVSITCTTSSPGVADSGILVVTFDSVNIGSLSLTGCSIIVVYTGTL